MLRTIQISYIDYSRGKFCAAFGCFYQRRAFWVDDVAFFDPRIRKLEYLGRVCEWL
jgi:hypothetical protein